MRLKFVAKYSKWTADDCSSCGLLVTKPSAGYQEMKENAPA